MSTRFNDQDIRMLRHLTKTNGLYFSRYFFKQREGRKFMVNDHHKVVDDTLEQVLNGEIKRLIINIPPGYTKTEEAVVKFMARGLALNPKSLFMHLSYADDLALWNSTLVRDTLQSEEFQTLFPMAIRSDISAKKKWYTEAGGGVYATSAGGPVTGFRAGRMVKNEFTGAMIIDDPIKPQDAYSDAIRERINDRFNSTFLSRLALKDTTPIILIMQRIHEDDPSGFLLRGGSGEKWHHLLLPMDIPEQPIEEWYPTEYTHGIPIKYDLPAGPLWEFKHSAEEIEQLKKADPYTHAAQNMQQPSPKGGAVFKDEYWRFYSALPVDIKFKRIYVDSAQKTGQHNDWTVFQCWGYSPSFGIFLLGQKRGKWESPQIKTQFELFFNHHNNMKTGQCKKVQQVKIEDKSSGSGLIQDLKQTTKIPVKDIQRNRDKVMRAMDTVPQIASGNVYLSENADYIEEYLNEFKKFTPLMTHKHDDQIDPTMDAIEDMLISGNSLIVRPRR